MYLHAAREHARGAWGLGDCLVQLCVQLTPAHVVPMCLSLSLGADLVLALRALKLSLRVQSSPFLPGAPLLVQLLYSLPTAGWQLACTLRAWILMLGGRKFAWSWLARPRAPGRQALWGLAGRVGRPEQAAAPGEGSMPLKREVCLEAMNRHWSF